MGGKHWLRRAGGWVRGCLGSGEGGDVDDGWNFA
jgi:hypothetical protein